MARTKPIFTAQLYDRRHLRNIASQLKAVQALYWDAIDTLCNRGERWLDVEPGRELHFEDFPMFNTEADKVVQNLARQLQLTIEQGNEVAWTLSNLKNDTMVKRMGFASHVPPEKLKQWTMPHMEALEQFNARVVAGMNLSERVWNLAQPFKSEMELALEIGISDGLSAADLSRQVRRHLNEPNRLFRRVRDRDGNLRLSKAAAAYHPGRGVYRSSYKNALRMTATENNMAYHTADHQRWKQLDFVTGIEISTSPTNHPVADICDELKGIYPKDFKFVGWHPWCRCIATAKTADDKQFDNYIDRMLAGEDVDGFHFEGEVAEMPECFTSWVRNNQERIARARTTPYFIADNYVDGDPSKGFKWLQKKKTLTELKTDNITFTERLNNKESAEQLKNRLGDKIPDSLKNFAEQIKANTSGEYDRSFIGRNVERILEETMVEAIEGSDFGMLIHPDILEKIIDSHFMNQIETGTSNGIIDSLRRREFSLKMFGTPLNSPPEAYEKYGLLLDRDKRRAAAYVKGSEYGEVQVRFKKDKVIATFTTDDSLVTPNIAPSLTTAPKTVSIDIDSRTYKQRWREIMRGRPGEKTNTLETYLDSLQSGYIELQYHGKLTAEHIESITFPSLTTIINAKQGVTKALEKGIDVFYIDGDKVRRITKAKLKKL